MKTFKVPFAYKEGQIIDIESAVKGEIYKCNCGADVKLRGGDIISNHFYHINESECSLESAIHKAYKEVFLNLKMIKLPFQINGKNDLEFGRVELEKRIDDYQPDAIGYINGQKIIVEFAKSSYIDSRKEAKIKKSNLTAIEVDIITTVKTLDEISNHLLNETYHKHIIHLPEYAEMKQMREKFEKSYRQLQQKLWSTERAFEEYKELTQMGDMPLYFKTKCKNGADLYKNKLDNGDEIIAFVKGKVISLKLPTYTA